jgi:hypothetical protein
MTASVGRRWRVAHLATLFAGAAFAAVLIASFLPTIYDPTEGTRTVHILNDSRVALSMGMCDTLS